ncbi:MAG: hypothetical protein ABJB47_06575 [Actinomycetota bacterium]
MDHIGQRGPVDEATTIGAIFASQAYASAGDQPPERFLQGIVVPLILGALVLLACLLAQ